MDISPATIGAISAVIGVPIFMGLMRKVDGLKHSPKSKKTFEELAQAYGRWYEGASFLTIVFAAAIGFTLWKGLSILSALQMSHVDKSIFLIPQPSVIWALPALFLGICLSAVPLHYLYLALLGRQRYAEYTEYGNQKLGVNSWKLLRYMGYVVIPICLIFTFLSLDSYARVTNSSFIVNRFFSVGEAEYGFGEIEAIQLIKSRKAPNGNIVRKPHYSIEFVDNTSYNFHKSLHDLSFEQQTEIVNYISGIASIEISVIDPYPR